MDPGNADAPEGYINKWGEGNSFLAAGHLTCVCSRMSHFKLQKPDKYQSHDEGPPFVLLM